MAPKHLVFLLPLVLGCTTGASSRLRDHRIPFTYFLIEEYKLTSDELLQLQFYVSERITLRREVRSGKHEVKSHRLRTREGKLIEEVIIEEDTPGVAIAVLDNSLHISFEKGQYLQFGSMAHYRHRKKGRYGLWASEWTRHVGQLSYAGKTFWAVDDSSAAFLQIDKESLVDVVKKRRVVPGRRLSQPGK